MSTIEQITPASLLKPSPVFPWPTLPVNETKLWNYLQGCIARHVFYGLGSKADENGWPLAAFPPCYRFIDCSGWVRAALAYSSGVIIPDGSYIQHDWCAGHHLKQSTYGDLLLKDGALRIAFIAPNWQHSIGHVYLVRNARTMESHGGKGPDSRSPLVHVLHAFTTAVYVLTPPEGR